MKEIVKEVVKETAGSNLFTITYFYIVVRFAAPIEPAELYDF